MADPAGRRETAHGIERRVLLSVALGGEAALGAAGLTLSRLWHGAFDIPWALSWENVATGAAVALCYVAGLIWMLRGAPDVWPARALRRISHEVLRPLFASAGVLDILLISLVAGVGEELMFRGALQPILGLPAASLVFGACHLAGRDTVVLALWAAVAGGVFGVLMELTGGLAAPMTAHAAYDALALMYLRRTSFSEGSP